MADLTVFLEEVGGGPVHLLGHSMGGRVAMELTVRRPDLVHSLIPMDTSVWSFLPLDDDVRTLLSDWIESLDPEAGLPTGLEGGPEEALIEVGTPVAWRDEKEVLQKDTDPYAFKGFFTELFVGDTELRSRLPTITCPTTVIAGEHDHPMVDQAPELAAEVGQGRVAVIEGAYHSPQLTHRTRWLAAVRDHLAWAADAPGPLSR